MKRWKETKSEAESPCKFTSKTTQMYTEYVIVLIFDGDLLCGQFFCSVVIEIEKTDGGFY